MSTKGKPTSRLRLLLGERGPAAARDQRQEHKMASTAARREN